VNEPLPDSINEALRRAARYWPDEEAIVDGDVRLTFGRYLAEAERFAKALLASGVHPGEAVGVWLPNSVEFALVSFGTYLAGGVLVPINTRYRGDEAAYILGRSRARVLFTRTDFLGNDYIEMLRVSRALDELLAAVVTGGQVSSPAISSDQFLARGRGVDGSELESIDLRIGFDTVSDILFTSGTTGQPKGAMLTHGASVRSFDAVATSMDIRHGDRMVGIPPFFHTYGLKAGLLVGVLRGATMYPVSVYEPKAIAELIAKEKITYLSGPPTVHLGLLDTPGVDPASLSSLRTVSVGAAGFSQEGFRRIRDELGVPQIATGYGMTEAHSVVTRNQVGDTFEAVSTSVGKAVEGVELRVVDDDGRDVPYGEEGELLVRGYVVMQGYFDDPESTAAAIDPDGWYHTGDIAKMVLDDRVRILDRKKDMVIVGGFNAYPAEIERILGGYEPVGEVAVIGVPDSRLGEVCKAFVVARPGHQVDPDALLAWAREHMANFKVPREVSVVQELPRNASGKVTKFAFRTQPAAGTAERGPLPPGGPNLLGSPNP
jgi:acyl-CoA synthetase (AMP-forming)/AMP-acid ligase II